MQQQPLGVYIIRGDNLYAPSGALASPTTDLCHGIPSCAQGACWTEDELPQLLAGLLGASVFLTPCHLLTLFVFWVLCVTWAIQDGDWSSRS